MLRIFNYTISTVWERWRTPHIVLVWFIVDGTIWYCYVLMGMINSQETARTSSKIDMEAC